MWLVYRMIGWLVGRFEDQVSSCMVQQVRTLFGGLAESGHLVVCVCVWGGGGGISILQSIYAKNYNRYSVPLFWYTWTGFVAIQSDRPEVGRIGEHPCQKIQVEKMKQVLWGRWFE